MSLSPTAIFYMLFGAAFLGLTLKPASSKKIFYNVPAFYLLVGAISALFGLPWINPMGSELELLVIEHTTELIVIIALAGAGLAIDLPASWKNWRSTFHLILFAMPLTIISIAWLGWAIGGLSIAGAVLLGAALAPTDPVLARDVQVGPPGSDEHGVRGALTAEAGLNDGLAFPFVWLAIGLSAIAISGEISQADFSWWGWLTKDVLYRIAAGVIVGLLTGWAITKILFSSIGDAKNGQTNAVLFLLAATCLSYGVAEAIQGYGFLSVFIAARAGRRISDSQETEKYENAAHRSADQLEAVLMALLLLWLGGFIARELWHLWTWSDLIIALICLIIVRPLLGWISLWGAGVAKQDRFKLSVFGVRGLGTVFYIAYAQNHGNFNEIEAVWRIAGLTILLSIIIHGCLANLWMDDADQEILEA